MKKAILVVIGVFVAQQVFSATDEEVQQAYSELENITNDAFTQWYTVYNNLTVLLLENLALERLDGKLALNNRLSETIEKINTLGERTSGFDNINTTECTYEACLYNTRISRYNTSLNIITAKWNTIVHLGLDFITCTEGAINDCKGDAVCGDNIIAEIEQKKIDAPFTINVLGENMLNALDSLSNRCNEQILTEFNHHVAATVEYVASCIDRNLNSAIPLMCNPSTK